MIDVLTEELRAPITEETAELYVGGTVFKTGPPTRVGVELEWLVQDADHPGRPVRPGRLAGALAVQVRLDAGADEADLPALREPGEGT